MEWWQIVVIALSAYLLLTIGPWVALQVVGWLVQRSRGALADEEPRLQTLREGEQNHSSLWPTTPRAGRYEEPDRKAQENLGILREVLGEADRVLPALSSRQPPGQSLVDALIWRAWGPLIAN